MSVAIAAGVAVCVVAAEIMRPLQSLLLLPWLSVLLQSASALVLLMWLFLLCSTPAMAVVVAVAVTFGVDIRSVGAAEKSAAIAGAMVVSNYIANGARAVVVVGGAVAIGAVHAIAVAVGVGVGVVGLR